MNGGVRLRIHQMTMIQVLCFTFFQPQKYDRDDVSDQEITRSAFLTEKQNKTRNLDHYYNNPYFKHQKWSRRIFG